jgi:hypothetical protein
MAGLVLAIAAFVLSWRQKSLLVSILMLVVGALQTVNAVIATRNFTILAFPGPISGVIVGVAILGLGIAKSINTAKKMRTARMT